MRFDTISCDEQKLFTLLYIHYYNAKGDGKSKADRQILLRSVPNMTENPFQSMTENYMDQILGELQDGNHITTRCAL